MFAAMHYSMSQPSYNLLLHQNLIPLDMQPSRLILQNLCKWYNHTHNYNYIYCT